MNIIKNKNFPVDVKTMKSVLMDTIPCIQNIYHNTVSVFISLKSPISMEEVNIIDNYWNSLTQAGEALKLTRNSRKTGQELRDFKIAVTNYLYSKNWATLTLAEKKFIAKDVLTDEEMDSLVTE